MYTEDLSQDFYIRNVGKLHMCLMIWFFAEYTYS